jgi:hypothetical protein
VDIVKRPLVPFSTEGARVVENIRRPKQFTTSSLHQQIAAYTKGGHGQDRVVVGGDW